MKKGLKEDIDDFVELFRYSSDFANKNFLITGSTGLIGSYLIYCLLGLNKNIKIFAPVRNLEKARSMYGDLFNEISFVECDLSSSELNKIGSVDYVVHCAAPTASKFFIEHPVETFNSIYDISKSILDYSLKNKVKSVVLLSSLEVYGTILDDSAEVTEDIQGYINPLNTRSSYPMAKRAMECLAHLFAKQYGLNVSIARLTQTTASACDPSDNRIIAQFARLTAHGDDIIMHTTGESARPYCYCVDAINAILTILKYGNQGEAYNVCNEETYISARGMAEFLKENFNNRINIIYDIDDNMGYAPVTKLKLSSSKLRDLGWAPYYSLNHIFARLINSMK